MESFKEFLDKKAPKKEVIEEKVETVIESSEEENLELIEESIVEEDHKIEIIEESKVEESKEEVFEGYKIYRDKSETFICDMEITGANPSNSKARIIIESKDLTYMFEGTISEKGQCKIPLKKMNFLNENERGIIKLEVIAEDMMFTPWSEEFMVVSSRKVQVKNITESTDSTPKVDIRVTRIK
jgi:hypothetical protein